MVAVAFVILIFVVDDTGIIVASVFVDMATSSVVVGVVIFLAAV